jgi:uncharacterized NAD-dependent epimerase/dehydratase family protein
MLEDVKNSEIHKLYNEYKVVKFIELGRDRWAGYVMRMQDSDPAKKVLCTKPGRSRDRRRDRPKLRKCDESEKDVARVGCRNSRINAQSREQWRKLKSGIQVPPMDVIQAEEEEEEEEEE